MADNHRFQLLFDKYANKEAEAQEKLELFALIHSGEYDSLLDELIGQRWKGTIPEWPKVNDEEKAEANFNAIMRQLKVRKMTFFRRVAVAAAIILVAGLGGFYLLNKKETKSDVAKVRLLKNDIDPGKYKAKLTLADGSTIVLDSAQTGELAKQGNTVITNKEGQIIYEARKHDGSEVLYNGLSTARGEMYATVLSDGTKVWLNSASSIRYPVTFIGNERRVEITGEAYFEVAHNASKPFRVSVNDMTVEVLGTHFNINSYSDEDALKTTLLEGTVKVTKGDNVVKLVPGEQSVLNGSALSVNKEVNTDEVVAWKQGLFHFEDADLSAILRQFARWYDVQVVYEGAVPQKKFFVIVKRNSSLASVLKALQANNVKFRIEGKKLIVQD